MKNKIQQIIVDDKIYGFNLVFMLGDKNEIYNRMIINKVPKSQAKDILTSDGIFINSDDSGINYQIIGVHSNSIYDIIHEIEHHVFFVLTKVGIPINIDTDEAFTYYSGYILSQILPIINKKHGRKTPKNTKRTRK